MREIKFRAKIQGHKGYVYGVPHNVYSDESQKDKWFDSMQYIDDAGKPQVEYIESDTLSEYTGLKDKNDKEIYEGDVCKSTYTDHKPSIGVVQYFDEDWGYSIKDDIPGDEIRYWETVEIIGNIYENPELIK